MSRSHILKAGRFLLLSLCVLLPNDVARSQTCSPFFTECDLNPPGICKSCPGNKCGVDSSVQGVTYCYDCCLWNQYCEAVIVNCQIYDDSYTSPPQCIFPCCNYTKYFCSI
jgi:hypothetical protein